MKKLYRSKKDKIVFGIFGGMGEYFDVDPVILRIGFLFFLFATGIVPLVVAYLIAPFIVPYAPSEE